MQRFVDASAIGWYHYLYGGNAKANEMIKRANPEMTDGQIAYSIAKLKEYQIVDSNPRSTPSVSSLCLAILFLDGPRRASTTSPPQFLGHLSRRAGKRAERTPQAGVFASPFFVFGWKYAGNPKRFDEGSAIRSEQIDH